MRCDFRRGSANASHVSLNRALFAKLTRTTICWSKTDVDAHTWCASVCVSGRKLDLWTRCFVRVGITSQDIYELSCPTSLLLCVFHAVVFFSRPFSVDLL